MSDDFDEDENIGQSVLAVDVDEIAIPIPLKDLQPWHRPRKQFIREKQWQACAAHLIDRLQSTGAQSIDDGKLRYLTLPGIDHFDVEAIGRTANSKGLKLEATGFLSEAAGDPIRARSDVRADSLIKSGLIEDTSITFPYNFEEIASPNAQAYRNIQERAPFHMVNIDACGSIASPSSIQPARLLNAIFSLIGLQFQRMLDPWCLFLTTDARHHNVSSPVLDALSEAIRQNAQSSKDFKLGAENLFGQPNEDLEEAFISSNSSQEDFLKKFSLGFAKWLLHQANDQGWDMKTKKLFCYATGMTDMEENADENDLDEESTVQPSMPCLAFEFRKQPPRRSDLFGAVENPQSKDHNNTDYSMMALNRVRQMGDLDYLFSEDSQLRTEYAYKQRDMLKRAGYTKEALQAFDEQFIQTE